MTFRPLFFLPRSLRLWAYHQAMWERLLDTPFGWLFWSFDRLGVEFWYKGDSIIWTWPWTRHGKAPFISLSFTGTGEFGDARYWNLGQIDAEWRLFEKYDETAQRLANEVLAEIDRRVVEACLKGIVPS